MKQWEIYDYPFDDEKSHPVVLISCDERIEAGPAINGLICRTIRAGKPLRVYEVPLDRADGLDWATGVQCIHLYPLDPRKLKERRGEVSYERRRQISKKIWESFRLLS